ncbi:MAG: protein kinase family protein [bacterium]|nr:protein kinase family protein [bacterium]
MGRLFHLKVIRDSVYTKLSLVKDAENGQYYVEKSLSVSMDFQKQLFKNEIRVHSTLENRYVARFMQQTGEYSFLMEYASMGNLQSFIENSVDDVLRVKVCLNFLKGLSYMHEIGLVHNDIKPSNILICKDYRAKLTDFAFAGKIDEQIFSHPPQFFQLGTDCFRRPGMGDSTFSRLDNDIYAAGVVLYLLFSGRNDKCDVSLGLIQNPVVRQVVKDCLNCRIRAVKDIIASLSELK